MQQARMAAFAALLLCGAFAVGSASSALDHPVSKVIKLLEGLSEKVEAEAKDEEIAYTKFEHWCANSEKSLNKAIAKEKEAISELESAISGYKETAEALEGQIAELEEELGELDKADAKAKHDRGEGGKLYKMATEDYDDTIKAIKDAIAKLETAETNTESLFLAQRSVRQALALASSKVTEKERVVLSAFVQQTASSGAPAPAPRPEFAAAGDYEKHQNVYSFKSNSVIELLKDLQKQFEADKLAAVKSETNSANAYELAKAARADTRTAAEKSKKTKGDELSDVKSDLATAKGDLKTQNNDLKADSKTLEDTVQSCAMKNTEWSERSKVREQEKEAIAAAIKILSKATGVRTEEPSNPVPPPSPVSLLSKGKALSFLQLPGPLAKAVKILRDAAHAEHSKSLDLLAQQASMGGSFDKVINMIEKMIFRLMDEQKNEDTHKLWCDKELSKTNSSLVDKEEKMEELNAKLDDAKSREKLLAKDIADDNKMIAEINSHVAEATEIREIGKKENALAVKDAKEAQEAITNAIAVLEEFYKKSGMVAKESWEFVQKGVDLPDEPSTWGSSYTGVADPASQPDGIISVLKKVSEDFATMEHTTQAQEETDQSAFEESMKANAIEKAGREKSVEVKGNEKKRLSGKIAELTSLEKQVADEHAATSQYLADLQPACVEGSSTYEDRKAARSREVEALRQAQGILATAFDAPAGAPAAALVQGVAAPSPAAPHSFLQRKQ